jgi:uncharacterized membrane protein YfcA
MDVLSGSAFGMLGGLTGIGGASWTPPPLTLLFGITPALAVGTDPAYTALGLGWLGSINWLLLATLLLGFVPGITTGAMLARSVPETFLRGLLGTTLTGVAAKRVL